MGLRTIATFFTTIPDDTQWSDDGEINVPGGKEIARVVKHYLDANGMNCGDPAMRDNYGWELLAEFGANSFRIVVQMVDEWILQCEPVSNSQIEQTSSMLRSIANCLSANRRFTDVRWFDSKDFEKGDLSKASDHPC